MWDISTKELCFAYGGKINILDNMNVSIQKHSFSAVMGPNGCGKLPSYETYLTFILRRKEV
ncbi:MAG TPA: hypothetical protein PLU28_00170 [Petrotogaceae bacterium]|mgnify:CR=1 FL=1|jgi:ABC-type Mn2+/Zn2+ transport system ATPase subunit|nr:hypothetical protein [Petrotogaceae bacterium]HQC40342.1 hypothetical protein [Petrotogaceae bacterium]